MGFSNSICYMSTFQFHIISITFPRLPQIKLFGTKKNESMSSKLRT
jgi:hypothetical protein